MTSSKYKSFFILTCFSLCLCYGSQVEKYTPDWTSLDSRPLPEWYDNAKIGIFIHFGVFSVPGFVSEWFWCYWKCPDRIKKEVLKFIADNYPPNFTYQDFASEFKLEFFNASDWVRIFEGSGARYVVLTSKHHDGFTMWPSKYSFSWNSMDVGPKRDVVGEFEKAVRKSPKLHFGLYHSLFEWFNPMFADDVRNNFTTRNFAANKGTAELYELVDNYKPDLIWSDGDPAPVEYWDSTGFLAWLYNDSPVKNKVVVNDRWGMGTSCKHGGFLNCADRYNPGTKQGRKWENAMTLDKSSWGNRRNARLSDFLTIKELLIVLAQTVSNGGNLLVNVGPTKEGTIPVIMQERLSQLGNWLNVNGEAIYESKYWVSQNDSLTRDVYYTSSKDSVNTYAIFFHWPQENLMVLSIPEPSATTRITLLGYAGDDLIWRQKQGYLAIWLPEMSKMPESLRSNNAWTVKLIDLKNN